MFPFPIFVPSPTLISVTDVITDLKTVASRNQLISKTSINQGFENNAGYGPFGEGFDSTYATATAISGTLSYPQSLNQDSRWTTLLTINEGASPGTTVVNVNGGAYTATDETILYSKTTGLGASFKMCQFQVPIGFGNLSSVAITFNKASSTSSTNSQQVYVLPGKWGGVTNSFFAGTTTVGGGGAGGTTSLSVAANDLVFVKTGVSVSDSSIPTINHGGPAWTRVLCTNATYGNMARSLDLSVMDAAGTFTTDANYTTTTTSSGGSHGGGGTTTTYYHYSNLAQSMRFIQP